MFSAWGHRWVSFIDFVLFMVKSCRILAEYSNPGIG